MTSDYLVDFSSYEIVLQENGNMLDENQNILLLNRSGEFLFFLLLFCE